MNKHQEELLELAEMEYKLWSYVDSNAGHYRIWVMSGEVIITVDLLGEEVYEESSTCKYLALRFVLNHYGLLGEA
ncbi:hypothetical protein VPDG_00049 [Vibrio phage henriette 12B8]|uniref:hypothetical protein n=1 Tax=Vibrio phage henriette 12B8 TaxID=573174 RepID=UPI0002C0A3F0|nr:hypothetical protein VPDG_00049 [Vibrio phage henriette 12B8]AGG58210.1 hypothetical protein VPDG_00049 [Vibrio phage henriette 12B8]